MVGGLLLNLRADDIFCWISSEGAMRQVHRDTERMGVTVGAVHDSHQFNAKSKRCIAHNQKKN
jgi:hypothetical protein